jgi:hypothetical protein
MSEQGEMWINAVQVVASGTHKEKQNWLAWVSEGFTLKALNMSTYSPCQFHILIHVRHLH